MLLVETYAEYVFAEFVRSDPQSVRAVVVICQLNGQVVVVGVLTIDG